MVVFIGLPVLACLQGKDTRQLVAYLGLDNATIRNCLEANASNIAKGWQDLLFEWKKRVKGDGTKFSFDSIFAQLVEEKMNNIKLIEDLQRLIGELSRKGMCT